MMRKLEERYGGMHINNIEAADIMWKKIDEVIETCNFYEKEIQSLKETINNLTKT